MELWKYIPKWMISILHTKICSQCQRPVDKSDIVAVGIRPADNTEKFTLYVEHTCLQCKKRVITSFSKEIKDSVEDLCYTLIRQIQATREIEKSIELSSTKQTESISDKEVKELKKFMENNSSHEDFMKFINAKSKDERKSNDKD